MRGKPIEVLGVCKRVAKVVFNEKGFELRVKILRNKIFK
jgi:hypothetical protein